MEKASPMYEEDFERRMKAEWTSIIDLMEYMDSGKGDDTYYDLCVYQKDKKFNKTIAFKFFDSIIEWFESE